MAKSKTYITMIRASVAENHGGKVPKYLDLTIRNYACALSLRDKYLEKLEEEGVVIVEVGSMGQQTTKQHPLCNMLYQQEQLCMSYAKTLGLTAAKAAAKTEAQQNVDEDDPMAKFYQDAKK
jgi:hypothetical protein